MKAVVYGGAYGCVRNYAEILGYSQAAELLQETLEEEEKATRRSRRWGNRVSIRPRPPLLANAGEEEEEGDR